VNDVVGLRDAIPKDLFIRLAGNRVVRILIWLLFSDSELIP
jgi:hypothetical protein